MQNELDKLGIIDRLGDVENKVDIVDKRVISLEYQYQSLSKHVEVIDMNTESIEKQLREQRDDNIRSQTMLQTFGVSLSDLQGRFVSLSEKQDKALDILNTYKLESANQVSAQWRYAFWFISGIIVSGIFVAFSGHFFKFV